MSDGFSFTLEASDGPARLGVIETPRGKIRTPAFMPVGTAGTVKAMPPDNVRATGADIVLGNTYHLMLRPGAERVAALGGLHKFMNWPHAILTDSGGFQVMSLAKLRKLTEEGVAFQSHIDGAPHMLTPERSIEIQCLLGADIQMQLDECPAIPIAHGAARESMLLSVRWAERSRRAFEEKAAPGQALFGIVQGANYDDLRRESLARLLELDFPGYAVGGLAVGEGRAEMFRVLEIVAPEMPAGRPRYLMGVGKPADIVGAVARGMDMFDCVAPTRSGRHGQAWTRRGPINIKNAAFADDPEPLDPSLDCPASRDYSKAYLHHLFRAGEYLGPMLLTWHNLAYYQALMAGMRAAIAAGRFGAFVARFREETGETIL
ncbi:tRNA guanosine(34) transglycosylase Tgt [Amphiplicatus metriothermophilus]|uniref:Queuine tRNA-ribosyltransferase n=1 Tax=Amphiplicatus metriothermophilus TaxID=1519374 RepID=A0A239PTZ7_9PROT|nr:tRNA guanosine(34) transglycosylase Tgt [Amphiplicatus metriothermophilus]MBB5519452.1 queuine tRNA-ribosyltransferase [Amphiplicatus metriothermophilus]SNT73650.1 tRNA-guanine transglycosylase [Amphiplicatus metriothermophilus]